MDFNFAKVQQVECLTFVAETLRGREESLVAKTSCKQLLR